MKLVTDINSNEVTEAEFCVIMQMIKVVKDNNIIVPVNLPKCYNKFIRPRTSNNPFDNYL